MDEKLSALYHAILEGDVSGAKDGVRAALDARHLFETGEYFVPDMLVAARAIQKGMAYLKPFLASAGMKSLGKVAIGTVKGDLHDIGKNLVGLMLEDAGFVPATVWGYNSHNRKYPIVLAI